MLLQALKSRLSPKRRQSNQDQKPAFSPDAVTTLEENGVDPEPMAVGYALNSLYDVHIPEKAMWSVAYDLEQSGGADHAEIVARLHAKVCRLHRTYDSQVRATPEGFLADVLLAVADHRLTLQCRARARARQVTQVIVDLRDRLPSA
jgi:hypothetical protein